MRKFFTERHGASKPRTTEALTEEIRELLFAFVAARVDEEWFGATFPLRCGDGYPTAGTDISKLRSALKVYQIRLPSLEDTPRQRWRDEGPEPLPPPTDGEVFDLLEYSYEVIAEPIARSFHSYMGHTHYDYDQENGRKKFAADVNRIFERNGIAFELKDGEVIRLAPAPLHEALDRSHFRTGDDLLNELLETSRRKFLHRELSVRIEALEKLWDGWERLKTLETTDKKTSATILLDKASAEPTFRARLETEARELTDIGNKFMIRHSETDKVPIADSGQVDYLFHRMFALIELLLRKSGRLA